MITEFKEGHWYRYTGPKGLTFNMPILDQVCHCGFLLDGRDFQCIYTYERMNNREARGWVDVPGMQRGPWPLVYGNIKWEHWTECRCANQGQFELDFEGGSI
jgi:hypothetical protein